MKSGNEGPPLRAVLDPGVLIAALLSESGPPAALVDAWSQGEFELIVCPHLLAELHAVLERGKFRDRIDAGEVATYLHVLATNAVVLPDPSEVPAVTPDPGDDYLVALAREGGADVLVSGDAHLTGTRELHPPVATPRDFLDLILKRPET